MKISEITEVKDTCTCDCGCGKPVCETCGKPHAKKDIKETTMASSIATSTGSGNGFASGGISSEPIKRVSNDKPKSKKKKKTKA